MPCRSGVLTPNAEGEAEAHEPDRRVLVGGLQYRPSGHQRAAGHTTVWLEEERRKQFWPTRLPSLSQLLHEFTLGNEKVAKARARGHGEDDGFQRGVLPRQVGKEVTTYVWFTYNLPCPWPDLVYGFKPHSDNSLLTADHAPPRPKRRWPPQGPDAHRVAHQRGTTGIVQEA